MVDLDFHMDAFVDRLTEFMGERNVLTFSKAIGIPNRTISSWVKKERVPTIEYLILLARKFECTIDYLVGLADY